jgi:uncharacterized membrane protein
MSKPKSKSRAVVRKELSPDRTNGPAVYIYSIAALLSLVGLADAIYLTVEKLTGGIVQCNGISNCEQVLSSQYATIGGIPLAAFGALAYFTVFSLATLAIFRNEGARNLLFYVVGLMLVISIWLFILQAFVIHAFCLFCLLSATVTLILSVLVALDKFYFKRK